MFHAGHTDAGQGSLFHKVDPSFQTFEQYHLLGQLQRNSSYHQCCRHPYAEVKLFSTDFHLLKEWLCFLGSILIDQYQKHLKMTAFLLLPYHTYS